MTTEILLTKIKADEGKVIALKSTGEVLGEEVYPAQSQTVDDFIEVPLGENLPIEEEEI
ncbi:MAG: hypothetical protein FWF72_06800 [Paludibacter sp.]|nr:hypothetical protein [Paludibacter sp.]